MSIYGRCNTIYLLVFQKAYVLLRQTKTLRISSRSVLALGRGMHSEQITSVWDSSIPSTMVLFLQFLHEKFHGSYHGSYSSNLPLRESRNG